MKYERNGTTVVELNDVKQKVIQNDIHEDKFEADMDRRVRYVIQHKYERCFERLKKEWEPKLKSKGIEAIPLDNDAFAELVFSQDDFKPRKQKESENI